DARATAAAQAPIAAGQGRAKSCIVLFLMGGPPQHSTWDPKPEAAAEVRGEFGPIATNVPGTQFCELMPMLARQADKLAVLRAVSTGDNAHSSSGYYMLTGRPHQPMNRENANPGAPNDWPNLGGVVQQLSPSGGDLPTAVRLPKHIFNTDGSVWPGQDAGFLGRNADPWMLRCEPASPDYHIPEFKLPVELSADRFAHRFSLLGQMNRHLDSANRGGVIEHYDGLTRQAFDLLSSGPSRRAFDLAAETDATRDRYGHTQFGQSTLLARRLVEAGVRLVQVNWFRGPEEPNDAPCWDSHSKEADRLKNVLMPPMDQAFSALLEDLAARGLLDETLVVCMGEFGRTPRFNGRAGRDHWGPVFSIAMAGGGVQGGVVHGASDALGAQPKDGLVRPEDITATIFHCLGFGSDAVMRDPQGRELAISHGRVIQEILA
ncbi:MAG: DUF1501 domain-containing protein, partial [Planctomycetales bacterium]|nr:DUF1501 domain-containing protein [Planctomycetales bacterium]